MSTPVTASTLGLRGGDMIQAQYLTQFRADSIVKDCEAVRMALTADYEGEEKKKWSIMGESFGGFCCVHYLSTYPKSLREAFLFGGLPPLVKDPDEVYKRLYKRVAERNKVYYKKYPEDIGRVKRVMNVLMRHGDTTVRDNSGAWLPARRFLQLGLGFGFHGGIDSVHEIVLRANIDLDLFGHFTRPTITAIESSLPFDGHPIYAILHEACYCQDAPSMWSAERVKQKYPEFRAEVNDDPKVPVYFTGEMVYPFMFDSYGELVRMKAAADMLAEHKWPKLYDEAKLESNQVPVYAAVYLDDMYVDYDLSMETARKINNCKTFTTSGIYHDGIRSKMDEVLGKVWALRDDVVD